LGTYFFTSQFCSATQTGPDTSFLFWILKKTNNPIEIKSKTNKKWILFTSILFFEATTDLFRPFGWIIHPSILFGCGRYCQQNWGAIVSRTLPSGLLCYNFEGHARGHPSRLLRRPPGPHRPFCAHLLNLRDEGAAHSRREVGHALRGVRAGGGWLFHHHLILHIPIPLIEI
jgi:hypothetical protein